MEEIFREYAGKSEVVTVSPCVAGEDTSTVTLSTQERSGWRWSEGREGL